MNRMRRETDLDEMRRQCSCSPAWDEYPAGDWGHVFSYASFEIEDVVEVIGSVDGANDGPNWTAVVRLKNGSYGYVTAGCDYTGWG